MNKELEQILKISSAHKKKLEKANLDTAENLINFFPRKYDLYQWETEQIPFDQPTKIIVAAQIKFIKNAQTYCQAKIITAYNHQINIFWFQQSFYIEKKLRMLKENTVYIQGEISYNADYNNYSMTNPVVMTNNQSDIRPIFPVYSEVLKINPETMKKYVHTALGCSEIKEIVPEKVKEKYQILSRKEAYKKIHNPLQPDDITKAFSYFLIENLYEYAKEMKEYYKDFTNSTNISIKNTDKTEAIVKNLPFPLTNSQKRITENCIQKMKEGIRIHSLVQGDVSCGKTLIAQILMMAVAENGYQAALIAPTTVLAEQHYDKLKALVNDYPELTCVLLTGDMKVKEKRAVLEQIESGKANLIVGTTSLLSKQVSFKNLGLAVTDEEHRFGVEQKDELKVKGKEGLHIMNMSATPIPRSLTQVMFGGHIEVETVTDMPPGRVPVKTYIVEHQNAVQKIKEEIQKGYKTYIICPQIENNEKCSKADVETIFDYYKEYFGAEVDQVTGRMKAKDIQEKIKEFRDGKFHILVSTTVVEVGVDVPDATLIIIEDADMFGISQLHQLRGRVGRSSIESYCYLIQSDNISDSGKERLKTLCETNDGMKIAEADMKMRGAGNILGTEQSGWNERFLMAMKYPETFKELSEQAGEI